MKAGAFMDAIEAIIGRRSIRKFQQKAVPVKIIQKLMDAARFYPSPANLQPLKFRIVSEQEDRARLAAQLHWAAYLPEFTPAPDELPPAYLVIIGDHSISHEFSFCAGAAAELLMLAAYNMGLGSCCLGFSNADAVAQVLGLKVRCYEPLYAIAIGYPKQRSMTVDQDSDCRYWLDDKGDFVVPKRTVQEITQ